MTDYERSGQRWKDDPALEVIDAYHHHVSEELGTDGPVETFGHPDETRVGHLVDDNLPLRDDIPEALATDTHDLEDLSVEELAMHYVDEDAEASGDGDDDLPGYLRASLAEER
jgi:hypothetical protein